ncbi:MAG: hypothetical protein ACFFCK_08235, partial [Promethearchaeota archaeon]
MPSIVTCAREKSHSLSKSRSTRFTRRRRLKHHRGAMVSVITFFVLTLCVSPTFPLFNEYRDVPEAGREQF